MYDWRAGSSYHRSGLFVCRVDPTVLKLGQWKRTSTAGRAVRGTYSAH